MPESGSEAQDELRLKSCILGAEFQPDPHTVFGRPVGAKQLLPTVAGPLLFERAALIKAVCFHMQCVGPHGRPLQIHYSHRESQQRCWFVFWYPCQCMWQAWRGLKVVYMLVLAFPNFGEEC